MDYFLTVSTGWQRRRRFPPPLAHLLFPSIPGYLSCPGVLVLWRCASMDSSPESLVTYPKALPVLSTLRPRAFLPWTTLSPVEDMEDFWLMLIFCPPCARRISDLPRDFSSPLMPRSRVGPGALPQESPLLTREGVPVFWKAHWVTVPRLAETGTVVFRLFFNFPLSPLPAYRLRAIRLGPFRPRGLAPRPHPFLLHAFKFSCFGMERVGVLTVLLLVFVVSAAEILHVRRPFGHRPKSFLHRNSFQFPFFRGIESTRPSSPSSFPRRSSIFGLSFFSSFVEDYFPPDTSVIVCFSFLSMPPLSLSVFNSSFGFFFLDFDGSAV